MTQYIDKAAIIAEMKRRIFNLEQLGDRKFIEIHFNEQFRFIEVYEGIIDFVNTLEVKEVDLEKETKILIWNNMTEEEKSDFFYNLSHQK